MGGDSVRLFALRREHRAGVESDDGGSKLSARGPLAEGAHATID